MWDGCFDRIVKCVSCRPSKAAHPVDQSRTHPEYIQHIFDTQVAGKFDGADPLTSWRVPNFNNRIGDGKGSISRPDVPPPHSPPCQPPKVNSTQRPRLPDSQLWLKSAGQQIGDPALRQARGPEPDRGAGLLIVASLSALTGQPSKDVTVGAYGTRSQAPCCFFASAAVAGPTFAGWHSPLETGKEPAE